MVMHALKKRCTKVHLNKLNEIKSYNGEEIQPLHLITLCQIPQHLHHLRFNSVTLNKTKQSNICNPFDRHHVHDA